MITQSLMARLPQPGSDKGIWGDILNDFLSQSHNADGSLKATSLPSIFDQGGVTPVMVDSKVANLATTIAGQYVQSSTVGANNGVAQLDSAGKLFASQLPTKLLSGIRPESYGALGNGLQDDTVAISSAIQAAASSGRPVVFNPASSYLVSSIQLAVSNLTLEGYGATIISNLPKSTASPVLWLTGSNVHIRDLTFTYLIAFNIDNDGSLIYSNGSPASTIRLGYVNGSPVVTDCSVERCSVMYSRNTSIFANGVSRLRITDNTCVEQGQGICVCNVYGDAIVSGNFVDRSVDDLIAILGDPTLPNSLGFRVIVTRNSLKRGYSQGIDLTGVDGCIVSDNIIDTVSTDGILVYRYVGAGPTGPDYRISVVNNQVRNAGSYYGTGQYRTTAVPNVHGINFDSQSNLLASNNIVYNTNGIGIQASGNSEIQIVNNQVINSQGAGINTSAGASLASKDVLVANNLVQLSNGGIVATGNSSYGMSNVRITSNVIRSYKNGGAGAYRGIFFNYLTNFAIDGNTIVNDTSGDVAILEYPAGTSSGKIVNSTGYNPVGKLGTQPSAPGNAVAVTNPSYVDCTVYINANGATITNILVGNQVTGLTASGPYRVLAGQSIQVNYNSGAPTWVWFGD